MRLPVRMAPEPASSAAPSRWNAARKYVMNDQVCRSAKPRGFLYWVGVAWLTSAGACCVHFDTVAETRSPLFTDSSGSHANEPGATATGTEAAANSPTGGDPATGQTPGQ